MNAKDCSDISDHVKRELFGKKYKNTGKQGVSNTEVHGASATSNDFRDTQSLPYVPKNGMLAKKATAATMDNVRRSKFRMDWTTFFDHLSERSDFSYLAAITAPDDKNTSHDTVLDVAMDVYILASKIAISEPPKLSYPHVLWWDGGSIEREQKSRLKHSVFNTPNDASYNSIKTHGRLVFIASEVENTTNKNKFGRWGILKSCNWIYHEYGFDGPRSAGIPKSKHLFRLAYSKPKACSHSVQTDDLTRIAHTLKGTCTRCETIKSTQPSVTIRINGVFPIFSDNVKYECMVVKSDGVFIVKSVLSWTLLDRRLTYGSDAIRGPYHADYFRYDMDRNITLHSPKLAKLVYAKTNRVTHNPRPSDLYGGTETLQRNIRDKLFMFSNKPEDIDVLAADKLPQQLRDNVCCIMRNSALCGVIRHDRLWWLYPDAYEIMQSTIPTEFLHRFSNALLLSKKKLWTLLSKPHNAALALCLRSIFIWHNTALNIQEFPTPYHVLVYERSNMTQEVVKDILRWIAAFQPDPDALTSLDFNLDCENIAVYAKGVDVSYERSETPCFYANCKSVRDGRTNKPFYWSSCTAGVVQTMCDTNILHRYDYAFDTSLEDPVALFECLTTIYDKRMAVECAKFMYNKPTIDADEIMAVESRPQIKDTTGLSEEQASAVAVIDRVENSFLVGFPGTGKTKCAEAIRSLVGMRTAKGSKLLKNTACITLTGSMADELSRRGFANAKTIDEFIFKILSYREEPNSGSSVLNIGHGSLVFDISSEYVFFMDEFSNVSDSLLYYFTVAFEKLKDILVTHCGRESSTTPPKFKCVCMMDPLQINPISGDSPCHAIISRGIPQRDVGGLDGEIANYRGVVCTLMEPHRFALDSDIYVADMCMIGCDIDQFAECFEKVEVDELIIRLAMIDNDLKDGCTSINIHNQSELRQVVEHLAGTIIAPDGSKRSDVHCLTMYDRDRAFINDIIAKETRNIWRQTLTSEQTYLYSSRSPMYVRNDSVMYLENVRYERFRNHKGASRFYELLKPQFNGKMYDFFGLVGVIYDSSAINFKTMCEIIMGKLRAQIDDKTSDLFEDTLSNYSGLSVPVKPKEKIKIVKKFLEGLNDDSKCDDYPFDVRKKLERYQWFNYDESFSLCDEFERYIYTGKFIKLKKTPEDAILDSYFDMGNVLKTTEALISKHTAVMNTGMEPVILFDEKHTFSPIFKNDVFSTVRSRKAVTTNEGFTSQFKPEDTFMSNTTLGWCTTVDKWQGRENEVVWFYIPNEIARNNNNNNDTNTEEVVSNRKNYANICSKSRAHVALTRAKLKFIVFGDTDLFYQMCSGEFVEYKYAKSAIYRELVKMQQAIAH